MNATVFAESSPPMPAQYSRFVDEAKDFVASRGLSWDIPLDEYGNCNAAFAWDLRVLTNSYAKNASRIGGFAVEAQVRALVLQAGWNSAKLPAGDVLGVAAQDFVKAVIAQRCMDARDPRTTRDFGRTVRLLLSSTAKAPWSLSTEDFDRFLQLRAWPNRIVDHLLTLAGVITKKLLSVNGVVSPKSGATRSFSLATHLGERKHDEKLPDKDALLELTRIVFQEAPASHNDLIRFAIVRILVLTGLRLSEVLHLPADCLRWKEHLDVVTGRPADEVGGIRRTLQLRYFGGKREEKTPDLLVEDSLPIPSRFAAHVDAAVQTALAATAELRAVLKAQAGDGIANEKSDLRTFRTTAGEQLRSDELLFLVEAGARQRDLGAPVSATAAVALISTNAVYHGVGIGNAAGKTTLFERYGRTDASRKWRLKPHSLRHLMNTELFRQNVPDTIITNHFGRRTIAQSYEYDHRTLAERLAFVSLPESANGIVPQGRPEELVAKMVVSGAAPSSHLARSFRAIQVEQGDEAAFAYLVANSDGFHVTPYGFCTNSFSVNPCVRHLKCFDDCRHFTASGRPEHRVSLEKLREQLAAMHSTALARPAKTVGRKNQVEHAARLLKGVDAALAANAEEKVFPFGVDHSTPEQNKDVFR
jgi:integrase